MKENNGGRRNRAMTVGTEPRVASREDLRVMSDDGLLYLEERLMEMSQSGNTNGLRAPPASGPPSFRGRNEELRDRAVSRMYSRTSNRGHSDEVNSMAAGLMRDRMERNLFMRR